MRKWDIQSHGWTPDLEVKVISATKMHYAVVCQSSAASA